MRVDGRIRRYAVVVSSFGERRHRKIKVERAVCRPTTWPACFCTEKASVPAGRSSLGNRFSKHSARRCFAEARPLFVAQAVAEWIIPSALRTNRPGLVSSLSTARNLSVMRTSGNAHCLKKRLIRNFSGSLGREIEVRYTDVHERANKTLQ